MKKLLIFSTIAALVASFFSCSGNKAKQESEQRDSTWTNVNHPEWSRNAVIYEVNWRQSTENGTIAEYMDQLPRLQELGVDILWFMPIHPISELNRKGTLGSYYAVKDYKDVNPELGTLDEFKALVAKAHELGMKVILDWVPNHSGCDNPWVTEHPEWYVRDEEGNPMSPADWWDVYKFDYSNPEMRAAMVDAFKFWLTEVDVDGFRCDVAGDVPVDFWDETRPMLEEAKPEIFMLAEATMPELQKNGFDMAYNWPQKDLFNEIAFNAGQNTTPEQMPNCPVKHAAAIDSLLAVQAAAFPADTYMMNMITNHDMNSWQGSEFERLGNLVDAMAVLSYTIPGMPLIYTGQETGLDRRLEFFEKDVPPTFEPRNEYFTFYQKLNELKHTQKALDAGEQGGKMMRYPTESPDLYVFSRSVDGSHVLVMVNLGTEELPLVYTEDTPAADGLVNFFTGETEELPTTLAPGAYRIYTKK